MPDELEIAMKEAYSLVPGTTLPDLMLIGIVENDGVVYKYFRNKVTGEYFYNDSVTEDFEKKMQEARKRRKKNIPIRRCF